MTRRFLLAVAVVLAAMLALGAVPGLVRWGAPFHLVATPTDDRSAIDGTQLPPRRYPYVRGALGDATTREPGRSDPYWRGPLGIKEAFSHSPFDELAALRGREPNATAGDAVYVRLNGTVYRLAVMREVAT